MDMGIIKQGCFSKPQPIPILLDRSRVRMLKCPCRIVTGLNSA